MSLPNNTDLLFRECSKPNPNTRNIKKFIESGIDPLLVDKDGYTLLMAHLVHSDCPDPTIITTLVNAGVKIQARNTGNNNNNMTALFYAACNKNSSLEVFQTLYKLGANFNDGKYERTVLHYYRNAKSYTILNRNDNDPIYNYLCNTHISNNAENTQVNGLFLHRALEKYIIETDNPDPLEISKIIQSYSHIPGIYPSSVDCSNEPSRHVRTKLVSHSLFQTIKVFFVAAAKRCDIEVFQTLLFDYGFVMAERFSVDLMDILAGNYTLESMGYNNSKILSENILSSYIESADIVYQDNKPSKYNYYFDFGDDPEPDDRKNIDYSNINRSFDLDTFKYLVSILNLNYGIVNSDTPLLFPLHPLLSITRNYQIPNSDYYLDIINVLLDSDIHVNMIDNSDNNVLMRYILNAMGRNASHDIKVITAFLNAGIDVNYKNKLDKSRTALMYLAKHNRLIEVPLQVFKTLIEFGADIYAMNANDRTFLSECLSPIGIYRQSWLCSDVVKYIISLIDFTKYHYQNNIDYYFMLYCKMAEHDLDVFNILLSHGPDLNTVDKFGFDYLAIYIKYAEDPDPQIITRFFECGVDIHYKNTHDNNHTHLHYAIRNRRSTAVIKCLVEHGARVDNDTFNYACYSEKGHSLSRMVGTNEKFKYLSSFFCVHPQKLNKKQYKKPKICLDEKSIIDNKIYITSEHFLEYCKISYPDIEMIKIFLTFKDIDVNVTDMRGYNALMILSLGFNFTPEMVITLANANIDLNYKNKDDRNRTILYYVCNRYSDVKVYNTLIECGADLTIVSAEDATVINKYLEYITSNTGTLDIDTEDGT